MKSKLLFPLDDAVKKTVYLSLVEIKKKWTMLISIWGIMNQFMLIFEIESRYKKAYNWILFLFT